MKMFAYQKFLDENVCLLEVFGWTCLLIRPPEESGEGGWEEAEASCGRAEGTPPSAGFLGELAILKIGKKTK